MKSSGEMAAEAWRRIDLRRAKRLRGGQAAACIACLAAVGALALTTARYEFTGAGPPTAAAGPVFLMFPGIGGYVLCGVICFALGAAAALLCLKRRKNEPAAFLHPIRKRRIPALRMPEPYEKRRNLK